MTLIDPLSFFSSTGVKEVAPPPTIKRPLNENTAPNFAKKPRQEEEPAIKCSTMPGVKASVVSAPLSAPPQLWVERYKPRKVCDLVGNAAQINKLSNWLKNWDAKRPVQSVRPGVENSTAKAALLSGTAGIGKTSTARLISESLGFKVIEFNASDTRSKNVIDELANGLATSNVLGSVAGASMGSRVVVIMDEVDGMSGGDRGGSAALIQMIKRTKLPIICICNDRQDNKVRSLANHCFDLKFLKPTRDEVANRASVILRAEQMNVPPNLILEIAESSGCDMRQVINELQLLHSGCGKARDGKSKQQKDLSMGPFEVVKGLFTSSVARTWDYAKRNEMFFVDYDLLPLLVQQNYLKCVEKVTDHRVLAAMQKANEYICLGDVVSRAIHQDSQWGLLPELGVVSTVAPSFACNNQLPFPDFPAWLGRQSTQGKNLRLMKELRNMVGSFSTTTSKNMKLSRYSDVLYETLVMRLTEGGIQATINLIDEMGVPKDVLFEVLAESRFSWQNDPYAVVDSKTKAALTRTYNSKAHVIKAGSSSAPGVAKKGRTGASGSPSDDETGTNEVDEDARAAALVKPANVSKTAKSRKK
jgi:replication factor C subunit 1